MESRHNIKDVASKNSLANGVVGLLDGNTKGLGSFEWHRFGSCCRRS